MKRYGPALLLVSLLVAVSASAPFAGAQGTGTQSLLQEAAEAKPDSDGLISTENDAYKMTIDTGTGILLLTEKTTGRVWESNPAGAKEDKVASGIEKTNLRSQLLVDYTDNTGSRSVINSYAGSLARHKTVFRMLPDGFLCIYTFENQEFTIPVRYELTKTGLKASILLSGIEETGDAKINKISLLPYFGAGGSQSTGYMLIPDGSGALIHFNNGKTGLTAYQRDYYGGTQTIDETTKTTEYKSLSLPVFGVQKDSGAFLAVIESGAACASLTASVAGIKTSYNNVYSTVTYRASDIIIVTDQTTQKKSVLFNALDPVALSDYTVDYNFLPDGQCDYGGMAAACKTYLKSLGVGQYAQTAPGLFVDFFGAATLQKSFLGIQYTGTQKLTTFGQAKSILEDLKKNVSSEIAAGYLQMTTDQVKGKIASRTAPMLLLGGKRGWLELAGYADKNGVSLFSYADFTQLQKSGNSYSKLWDVSVNLQLTGASRYPYGANTNLPDTSRQSTGFIRPESYGKALSQILSTTENIKSGSLYLSDAVQTVYSDFKRDGLQNDRQVQQVEKACAQLAQSRKLLLSDPNAYALPYASLLTDLPVTSSRMLIFDEDVPFLQMSLSGLLPYSMEAVNVGEYSDDLLLKCIETGSIPKFVLTSERGEELSEANLDHLYGSRYEDVGSRIAEWCAAAESVRKIAGNAAIESRSNDSGRVLVRYANGAVVYVNYTAQDWSVNGRTIHASDYLAERGERG